MRLPTLVTGDDFALPVNLKVNGVAWSVNPTTPVKAAVVSSDHTELLMAAVAQDSAAQGANWAEGTVVVVFPKASTAQIVRQGLAYIEIQVSGASEDSWFVPIHVIKGLVS